MRKTAEVSRTCLLLLAVLQLSTISSAPAQEVTVPTTVTPVSTVTSSTPKPAPPSNQIQPVDVSVAVGDPAVFNCGVLEASLNVTFIFYGSHGNYSLTCPDGHIEDIVQALYGTCEMKNGNLVAVWTLKGTSIPDNGTTVVCQPQKSHEATVAVLHVHDNGLSHVTLIACVIGGFFGILVVFALLYLALQGSETLQRAVCLWDIDEEDDLDAIVTEKEEYKKSKE